jgi:hypothetical protein
MLLAENASGGPCSWQATIDSSRDRFEGTYQRPGGFDLLSLGDLALLSRQLTLVAGNGRTGTAAATAGAPTTERAVKPYGTETRRDTRAAAAEVQSGCPWTDAGA